MVATSKPRGRQTPDRGARDVAQRILEEATKLFAARGFEGTSLQDIAMAVGIRKPSLLYHFPSKGVLRRSVLERMLGHWNETLPRLLAAATSGEQQFDAVVKETVAFFAADPDRARLLMREVLDRPDEIGSLLRDHVEPWSKIVADYIRKGQSQGRLHPDADPESYVVQVINLLISSLSTMDVLGRLAPDADGEPSIQRNVNELLRVARASLFLPGASQA